MYIVCSLFEQCGIITDPLRIDQALMLIIWSSLGSGGMQNFKNKIDLRFLNLVMLRIALQSLGLAMYE